MLNWPTALSVLTRVARFEEMAPFGRSRAAVSPVPVRAAGGAAGYQEPLDTGGSTRRRLPDLGSAAIGADGTAGRS